MKKILVGGIAILALAFSASAQEQGSMQHKHRHGHGKSFLMKGIVLTDEQKAAMKEGREAFRKQMAELNKQEDITVREYRAKKASLLQDQKSRMENLLTAEQKKQMAENRLASKARHQARAAKRLDKMKARLELSDDQVAKLKAARESMHAKLQSIRDNTQLSPEEKKQQAGTVRNEQKEWFKTLLTADQLQKMEHFRQERMDKRGK